MSNRSRSSSKSKNYDSDSQSVKGNSKRSLNYGKRVRTHNAISAENMRFVAQLVNVKATVPSSKEISRRDTQHRLLKKNLARSFNAHDNIITRHEHSTSK